MFMFMGLVAQMFDGLVASSSLVGGLGTLQYGIIAHGCSMGLNGMHRCSDRAYVATFGPERAMKDQLVEAGFLLPSRDQKFLTRNSHNLPKCH